MTVGYARGARSNARAGSRSHGGKPLMVQYTTNIDAPSARVGPTRKPFSRRGCCSSCHGELLSYSRNVKNASATTAARHTTRWFSDRPLPPPNIPDPQRARNATGARQMSVDFDKTSPCFQSGTETSATGGTRLSRIHQMNAA